MREKLTFFILSASGSPVKQTTVSKSFLRFLGIFASACLIVFSSVVYDYYNVKKASIKIRGVENDIISQMDEITSQRKQINKFADEINCLKTKLVELNNFEKKIRIIANIEKNDVQDNLFGVGGSIPEDLDTEVPLTERHNSLLREMHEQTNLLKLASTDQEEGFESLLKHLEEQRNLLASTPTIRPVKGWISSKFGYRKSPFTGLREFHKGLDIATRMGTPVIASADGIVTYSGRKGLMGNMVAIDHGYGIITRYAHLKKTLKKRGEAVKRGDTIGLVGNTGRSTGPHVHYEVHLNGIPVNPEKYILN
ncbi:MAG: M23 family metallopeptidase [Deltaproteobacteria bacterium]|nr:M23 family metallopeptidase [Deltaproteobacteria bacterium]MBW2662246.1 M23 family metallopeptidase [Deltaproteobacteria bacterium]